MKRLLFLLIGLAALPLFASDGATAPESMDLTHRMMTLALQVGVIIFAARVGDLLFKKLHLPSVLGELCAGIVIGPYVFGHWDGWLFQVVANSPVGVSPELYGLCTIASIVLLFLVGAETDLKMFMRYSAVGALVGIGGVIASYLAGTFIGMFFLHQPWDAPATILLGVMSTATSVSITARLLSERRKLDSREGVTILAGAVVDDVLGIIALAIGSGMILAQQTGSDVNLAEIGWISFRSFGVWLGATAVGILISRYVAMALRPCGSRGEVAVLALGIALVVGGLFEKANLAMIVGAYVTGLSFSNTDMGVMIQEKLHGVYEFLVPIFFVVMGMMVDVSCFANTNVLIMGAAYTGLAILAKIIGCGLPTFLFGFNGVGALRVGLGMVPRGEVALIIVGIVVAQGWIPDPYMAKEVIGVAVMMTLFTTLLAPPLLVPVFLIPWDGMRKAFRRDESTAPAIVYNFPNHAVTNTVMEKILINLAHEGFFTHQLDPARGLYQARMADTILTITCGDTSIAFEASAAAMPFVRIVVAESLAEFETVLEALRKPIAEVAHIAIDNAKDATADDHRLARMAVLARHIQEGAIIHRLEATSRDAIIHELLERLRERGEITDLKRAEDEVLHRENIMATGVGFGVACPHTRTSAVESLVCAIGITRAPVDFSDEEEGRDCRIIILTLTPDTVGSPYMMFITAVLTALRSQSKREALLAAPDAKTIRKLLLTP